MTQKICHHYACRCPNTHLRLDYKIYYIYYIYRYIYFNYIVLVIADFEFVFGQYHQKGRNYPNCDLFPTRSDIKVLDCGAGTGLVAEEVNKSCIISTYQLRNYQLTIRMLRSWPFSEYLV